MEHMKRESSENLFFHFLTAFIAAGKCEHGCVERLHALKKCRAESPG